jgi:ADP-heptose:LPS heptosyltransferase
MSNFSVIQLGDESEPFFSNVTRFAGNLSMRQSAAVLSCAQIFIGPDSLLMHIANGLNIPSLILFGGSRPAECFGYDQNTNLVTKPECSPCWIHQGYEECKNDLICMKELSTSFVLASLLNIQNN